MTDEVEKPHKTFPLALCFAMVLTCFSYVVPLVAVAGAISINQKRWETEFMADAVQIISSFIWLRRKLLERERCYRVPMGIGGLVVMCLVPYVFLVFIMVIATNIVFGEWVMTAAGIEWFFLMKACKVKGWLKFRRMVDED